MRNYAFVLWSVLSVPVTSMDSASLVSRSVSDTNHSTGQSDEHDYTCKVMATSPKSGEKIPYRRAIRASSDDKAVSDFTLKAQAWALKLHYSLDMSTLSCGSGGSV